MGLTYGYMEDGLYFGGEHDNGGNLVNSVHSCLHAEQVFVSIFVCDVERTPVDDFIIRSAKMAVVCQIG